MAKILFIGQYLIFRDLNYGHLKCFSKYFSFNSILTIRMLKVVKSKSQISILNTENRKITWKSVSYNFE